ncbi:hypothetical protein BD413DRAFT_615655 [Trametes elegans]|nr:hypothetical protein BD413DRAFT_615655 [Trametes elegans]
MSDDHAVSSVCNYLFRELNISALFAAIGFSISLGPVRPWAANNSSPVTRSAFALAILPVTLLVFQLGTVVCAGANLWRLARENARKRWAWAVLSGIEELDVSIWFTYVS